MRYRQSKMLRRILFFALLILIAAALCIGGYLLFFADRSASATEMITLAGENITQVEAIDNHLLMVDGTQLNYIDSSGTIKWSAQLPEENMTPVGSSMLNAAYSANRVMIFDKDGRPVLDQSTDYTIVDMACGSETYALTTWEENQRLVRVMKLDATEVEQLRFPYETVMDTGFYTSNLTQLWTLSLDSHFTIPVAHLKTFNPGQSTTGNVSMSNEVSYKVLPMESEFITVGTHNLQRWDSSGKSLYSKLVYGWTLIDMNVDDKGRAQFLFTPSNTSDDEAPLSSLWYIRMDSSNTTTEYRLSLPAGTLWACLGPDKILAFTAEAVHTTTYAGEKYRSMPLEAPVESVEAVLSGKMVVLKTVSGWKLYPIS